MNPLNEQWLPLQGWEAAYEISDLGRVRRLKKGSRSKDTVGKCLTHSTDAYGYAHVHLRDWPRTSTGKVHILVTRTFLGPPPEGHEVNHKNGNRMDPRLENLEYVTRSENHRHAYQVLGRAKVSNKGEKAGRAKLTDEQVLEIRRLYARGDVSQTVLAKQFGVAQTMIGFIVRRVSWTHI